MPPELLSVAECPELNTTIRTGMAVMDEDDICQSITEQNLINTETLLDREEVDKSITPNNRRQSCPCTRKTFLKALKYSC